MSPKSPDDFQVSTGNVNALLTGLSNRFDDVTTGQSGDDGTTAERHDGTKAAPKKPKPRPSKYTLLLDQDDALSLDDLAIQLRRRTGRRVEKSEIMRALIRLADTNPAVNKVLCNALDRRTAP
jgi:hypothetical protein